MAKASKTKTSQHSEQAEQSQQTSEQAVRQTEIAVKENTVKEKVYGQGILTEQGLSEQELTSSFEDIYQASMDNVTQGEIQVPRLSIAQPGTPEVAGSEDGWEPGMLYENINREPLSIHGVPPWMLAKGVTDAKAIWYLPIVTLFRLPSEYVLWPTKAERDAGQKMFHWKTLDPAEKRVREGLWPPKGIWQSENKKDPPPVTEHLNVLSIALDETGERKTDFIVPSFSRTSFKTGQKLVGNLVQHKISRLPWWGRIYYLFTEFKKNDKGQPYFKILFAKGPKLLDYCQDKENGKEIFMHCYQMATELSNKDSGRKLQETMINAAQFDVDSDAPSTTEDYLEEGTVTGTETSEPDF